MNQRLFYLSFKWLYATIRDKIGKEVIMYNVGAKNLQEVEQNLAINFPIMEEFMFMTELKTAFSIWEVLKDTVVSTVKIVHIKEQYNDEGLEVGVYCDVCTPSFDYVCDSDYEYEWSRDYRTRLNVSQKTGVDKEVAQILNDLNEALTGILLDKKLPYAYDILSQLEYVEFENNLEKIIAKISGPVKLQRWKIAQEKNHIANNIPASTSTLGLDKIITKPQKKI